MMDRLLQLIRANVQRGAFNLSAGGVSDWFVDLSGVTLSRLGNYLLADALAWRIDDHFGGLAHAADAIGGPGYGAAPIVGALLHNDGPYGCQVGFLVRPEPDRNGQTIVGPLGADMRAVLVDDVATTGRSLLRACREVGRAGATVALVITVVDREEGARALLEGAGYRFVSLYGREDLL